jgi:hypothetical protein
MRRHFPQENPALISPVDGESEEKPVLAKEAKQKRVLAKDAKQVKEEDVGESGTLKAAAPLPRLIYHRSVYLSIHREICRCLSSFFLSAHSLSWQIAVVAVAPADVLLLLLRRRTTDETVSATLAAIGNSDCVCTLRCLHPASAMN